MWNKDVTNVFIPEVEHVCVCHYKSMQRHVSASPRQAFYFPFYRWRLKVIVKLVSSCNKMLVQGYAFRCVLFKHTLKRLSQGVYQDGYRDNRKNIYCILFKIDLHHGWNLILVGHITLTLSKTGTYVMSKLLGNCYFPPVVTGILHHTNMMLLLFGRTLM